MPCVADQLGHEDSARQRRVRARLAPVTPRRGVGYLAAVADRLPGHRTRTQQDKGSDGKVGFAREGGRHAFGSTGDAQRGNRGRINLWPPRQPRDRGGEALEWNACDRNCFRVGVEPVIGKGDDAARCQCADRRPLGVVSALRTTETDHGASGMAIGRQCEEAGSAVDVDLADANAESCCGPEPRDDGAMLASAGLDTKLPRFRGRNEQVGAVGFAGECHCPEDVVDGLPGAGQAALPPPESAVEILAGHRHRDVGDAGGVDADGERFVVAAGRRRAYDDAGVLIVGRSVGLGDRITRARRVLSLADRIGVRREPRGEDPGDGARDTQERERHNPVADNRQCRRAVADRCVALYEGRDQRHHGHHTEDRDPHPRHRRGDHAESVAPRDVISDGRTRVLADERSTDHHADEGDEEDRGVAQWL